MLDKRKKTIEDMFDDLSQEYDFLNNLISLFLHKVVKSYAISMLNLKKDMSALDICTGTGDMARILDKKREIKKIDAIDISEKMIEVAKKKPNQKIKYHVMDLCDLTFKDESFDVVCAAFGLRNVEDIDCTLDNIKRVLKKDAEFLYLDFEGGKSVFLKLYSGFIFIISKIFARNKKAYEYLIESRYSYFRAEKIREIIENKGFALKKSAFIPFITLHIYKKISS